MTEDMFKALCYLYDIVYSATVASHKPDYATQQSEKAVQFILKETK